MTLRNRCALRLVAALAVCIPLAACDDKKMMAPKAAGTRVEFANAVAPGHPEREANTENYQHFVENSFVSAEREPQSSFSASVDTAAYTIIRSKIQSGQ